jgi:hypothetical protein
MAHVDVHPAAAQGAGGPPGQDGLGRMEYELPIAQQAQVALLASADVAIAIDGVGMAPWTLDMSRWGHGLGRCRIHCFKQ